MPTISMFYGIIISMFFEIEEKHHLPHIHARYQEHKASIAIEESRLLAGSLPTKQLRMVQVWVDLHREELLANWDLAKEGIELFRIDPLKYGGFTMLLDITYVRAKPDFSMIVGFENGEQKHFDMRPYIDEKPWIRLKEGDTFVKAYVLNGTVAWPGNLDIDPETLYERST